MPSDAELRGRNLPCAPAAPGLVCDGTELTIERADLETFPFTTSYVFPDAVLLVWGGSSTSSMELERSSDGGETWTAFFEPGNQDHDIGSEIYTSYADRTAKPGMTYHYRIKWNTFSEWFYHGNTFTLPGDPVVTPVWAAPRPVPTFESVSWDCPDGSSLFLCVGTLTLRLDSEPGESLAGSTISLFLNETTFEALDGRGRDVPIIWPEAFPFAGRDEPGCVERKAEPDLVIVVPENEDSVTIDVPNVLYGANSFRFVVDDGQGGFSERALLYGIHDEVGEHLAAHDQLLPLLYGTDVSVEDFELNGLGPVGIRSPDCADGDWRKPSIWTYNENIYTAEVRWWHVTAGYIDDEVGTDANGAWMTTLSLTDGVDHSIRVLGIYTCHPNITGHIGRSILAEDRSPITVYETAQEVCADFSQAYLDPIHVDISLEGPHPPVLDHVPESLFTLSDADVTNISMRFRITDLHHDVDLGMVTITNESMDPPAMVNGFYAEDQDDRDHGDWGWFVAEVPMMVPPGETSFENQFRFQVTDHAGYTLDELVTATRVGPLVWAEIAEPDPTEAEPRQLVTFDGSASIIPAFGDGIAVARWVFLRHPYNALGWEAHRDSGILSTPEDLIIHVPMPDHSSMKARLIVATSIDDLPADPWSDDLPCRWNEGDGRCDAKEIVVDMVDSSCYQEPDNLSAVVDSPASSLTVAATDPILLQAHVNSSLAPIAFRWVLYDSTDFQKRWPIAYLGGGTNGWSIDNSQLVVTAQGQSVAEGDYLLVAETRYPASGCDSTWYLGSSTHVSLRIGHTLDGVAPGKVIEGGTFRVYSRTWTEGADGYVFIDDVVGVAPDPMVYFGTVQPGGYLQITPLPGELPATGAAWYVSVAEDLDGTARSAWVNALQVETAGDATSPLLVATEEDISCGGAGTECAHAILPGQTWRGEWGEPGDTDYFSFIAGAGAEVGVTLERVDTTLPPQHPDAPGPEILLARPDDVVFAASDPLGLDDTGTGLSATLTMDGRYVIAVRTPKGAGQYRVTLTQTAEGGTGSPSFGFTNARTHLTTTAHPEAHMRAPILDSFGNPIAGSVVSWEQGSDCGVGEFCGNGMTTTTRTTADGHAVLDVEPAQGGDPLWRPQTLLGQALKAAPLRREAIAQKIAVSRRTEAVLGVLRISGDAVEASVLPDLATARAVKNQTRRRAERGGKAALKDGPLCGSHADTCPVAPEPVFRAVKLALAEGEELIDLEVRILDGGAPTERLDGHEIMTDIGLTLEAVATVRDGQGAERDVNITDPIAVAVSEGAGGALSNGVATCNRLDIAPGVFTYKTGRNAVLHQAYTEPDGSPCCWAPTEVLAATVVVKAEADDGQGGTILVTKEATTIVESIPRPADPCELRSLQPGTPQLATYDNYAAINTGTVYLTDACGNIVVGVGQNDSPNHDQPGDELRITSPLQPPGEGVWATALSNTSQWSYDLFLHGNVGTPDRIPDGLYTIDLEIASQNPQCTPGGAYTVQTTTGEPQVALWWDWIWDAENSPRGPDPEEALISPGSALRDRSGAVAMWRVPAFNDATVDHFFEGPYTDVPVKLYVASYGTIPFDEDGNLDTTYLEPIEGVELCTGTIEKLTDAAGHLDWNSPVRTTCDTAWTTFATASASSDPEDTALNPAGPADTWVPVGLGVGITRGPEQPGSYVLMAEPLDEAFRRGDSWKVITPYVPDGFIGFEVGGGMFLDEDWVVIEGDIEVPGIRTVIFQAEVPSDQNQISVEFRYEADGTVMDSTTVLLERVGLSQNGYGIFQETLELQLNFDLSGAAGKQAARGKQQGSSTVEVGPFGVLNPYFLGLQLARKGVFSDAELRLFLDVNWDNVYMPFQRIPLEQVDDFNDYLPCSDIETRQGLAPNLLPQVMGLVAAFAAVEDDNIVIIPPPSSAPEVIFDLSKVSQFEGIAMNYGSGSDYDFRFGEGSTSPVAATAAFDPVLFIARVQLICEDYGGFATATANAGRETVSLQIPRSQGVGSLPENGWVTATGTEILNTGLDGAEDEDNNPSVTQPPTAGLIGDGLNNYEEYRGFIVRENHRRTNPFKKDLFVSSNAHTAIAFLSNIPLTVHRIWGEDNEPAYTREYGPDRQINFNYTNPGYGGPIPDWSFQRAVRGIEVAVAPSPDLFGKSFFESGVVLSSPNDAIRFEVYLDVHQSLLAPPYGYTQDQVDNEFRRTFGHEAGHQVHICHRYQGQTCHDGANVGTDVSIMSTDLAGGADANAPESQYNQYDIDQIRLHEN
jgi:hypothetical protein